MAKIYARQRDPAYQESPLFLSEEDFPDTIAVCGNRDYNEHRPKVFEDVWNTLTNGELAGMLEDKKELKYYYKNATEAIMSYLPPENKPRYSTKEIGTLKELIIKFDYCTRKDEDNILCAVLSIVTGKEWNHKQITGSCQSEWNNMYYPADEWDDEALSSFEVQYFNEGTEWFVEECDDECDAPEPEDVVEDNIYCVSWNDEGIKKEIAEYYGAKPEDVVLYKFSGYTKTATYEVA